VRPLFLNTEPELFLLHREDFVHVALRADEYAQRELQPKDRGVDAWLRRLRASALCRQYAPIAALAADGRCFAVERVS
jgi:hypothetical protein